jgi:menaquinone-dependent protoporphyrinogen oxidase
MRVLVTWGSKHGGTEGIARIIAETLEQEGLDVDVLPPKQALRAHGFDAVIVGGALYANRWHKDARRFVSLRERDLLHVPVWFFSSGPLDASAEQKDIPPTKNVQILMERVGAQSHVTFGGKLDKDARGFPASAMAKKHAGDFRDDAHIRGWARAIAHEMPEARPRPAWAQPGRSALNVLAHAAAAWAICGPIMGILLYVAPLGVALAIHAITVPIVFALVARHYFRYRGAREPLHVAAAFVATTALLDAVVVAGVIQHHSTMLKSFVGFWLPLATIFLVTWLVGAITQMGPMAPVNARRASR